MSTWTSSETDTLIRLWPVSSARQIASTLQRSRSAVSRKAQRLCLDGVLPRCGGKAFRGEADAGATDQEKPFPRWAQFPPHDAVKADATRRRQPRDAALRIRRA